MYLILWPGQDHDKAPPASAASVLATSRNGDQREIAASSARPGGSTYPCVDRAAYNTSRDRESTDPARGSTATGEIPQEWFEAAARRPLEVRMEYAFIRTYKPVLDDAWYRSFESMETTAGVRREPARLAGRMAAFEYRQAQEVRDVRAPRLPVSLHWKITSILKGFLSATSTTSSAARRRPNRGRIRNPFPASGPSATNLRLKGRT